MILCYIIEYGFEDVVINVFELVYNLVGCSCEYYYLKLGYGVIDFYVYVWLFDLYRVDLVFFLLNLFEKC